jgi:hypothetical protein
MLLLIDVINPYRLFFIQYTEFIHHHLTCSCNMDLAPKSWPFQNFHDIYWLDPNSYLDTISYFCVLLTFMPSCLLTWIIFKNSFSYFCHILEWFSKDNSTLELFIYLKISPNYTKFYKLFIYVIALWCVKTKWHTLCE